MNFRPFTSTDRSADADVPLDDEARGAAVAVLVGISAFFIGFSAKQIATAQHTREAVEAGEM